MSKDPKTFDAITLSAPVTVDGKKVDKITLRKPKAGELRGMALANLLQMDVGTLITLLPRITMPPLTGGQVADLDPADFTALSTAVVGFFVQGDQLKRMGMQD